MSWDWEGAAAPSTKIMWIFGKNMRDSDNNTWEKSLQNNAAGMISKTCK